LHTNPLPTAPERLIDNLLDRTLDIAARSTRWPRGVKRLAVMCGDAFLGLLAVRVALSLRLGEITVPLESTALFACVMLALWFPIAVLRGVYSAIFRFSGRGAIVGLAVAVALIVPPLAIVFVGFPQDGIPRTLALIAPLLFLAALMLSRIVGRYVLVDLFSARDGSDPRKQVLIYGAGATGQRLADALAIERGMRVIGFVDDDHAKWGRLLDGKRIYRGSQIADLVDRRGITDVMLAMTQIGFARRKAILAALENVPVNVQTLPPMRALVEGRINADVLRPIEVEDLLGRAAVPEHGDLLARPIAGKLVMVTGAGGSIGSEICRQVIGQAPSELVLVDANEFALFEIGRELETALAGVPKALRPRLHQRLVDVSNREAVARLFAEFTPDTIFHAAAYKPFEGRRRGGRA